jgi:hypothetical protein
MSLWIKGKRRITLENANDLAKALGCTIKQIQGLEPFTKIDLTKEMPPIGTAQRYLQAIQGKWHATSIIQLPTSDLGHNSLDNTFEWEVDLICRENIVTGTTVCITPGHEQAQYRLHLEATGLGIILIDGIRDASDGATDIFRGILQFQSDTKTVTMNGCVTVYFPLLQRICAGQLNMRKTNDSFKPS